MEVCQDNNSGTKEDFIEHEHDTNVEVVQNVQKLKKLTVFQTSTLIVSSIGSSSVFIAMTPIVGNTGSVGLTLVVFIVSGLLNYSLAICFTEVAILIPKSGGPYFFVMQVFGQFPAFMFLWGFVLMIVTPVWALLPLTASLYIVQLFFPGCRPSDAAVKLLAICILLLVVLLNCLYMKYVTKVQTFLTSAKLIAMVIIILSGAVTVVNGEVENYVNIFEGSTVQPGRLALSLLASMFLYGGWQLVTFLLEQMESPEKNLPKALKISFIVTVALNVLTVAAYFVLIPPTDMLNADAVAVLFMERLYRPLAPVISVFVAATSIGALNSAVLGQTRLVHAAAKKGHMPFICATISEKYLMPWAATIMVTIISIGILLSGSLIFLIEMVSFYAVIMSVAVLLCLLALRIKRPALPRPVKVWLVTAIFQLVLNVLLLLMSIYEKPSEFGQLVLILVCGIPVYVACVRWKSKPKAFSRTVGKIRKNMVA